MSSYNSLCVGIDLGTTNSLIASCRCENGKINTPVKMTARIVDSRGTKRNDSLLPSCIYYQQDENGKNLEPIVGDFAKSMHASVPFRVSKSIKSQMGKANIDGLDASVPDKKPEDVSARIIKHLVSDLEKYYDETIKDVVITVPASFDPAQRLATLRAAEIAGIDVKNEDGSYNQGVLLSEPEAVMYYLLNQIKKGECDIRLDFSTPKNILVFDIGGGTLDITVHKVQRNAKNSDILNIDLIATNRFTPVAGDTFDQKVAEEMYDRYLAYYKQVMPSAVSQISRDREKMIAALEAHAEDLKLKINVRYDDALFRQKTLSSSVEFDCGGRMPNDYPYDDFFTKGEYEKCVESLLGNSYTYDDYKNIEGKEQTNDIIWPILDVLRKTAKKLETNNFNIDAVLISGGMSRFYMIKNRLEKFFGTHIISVPDPDTAVAQGAVVYHYHQHQNSELMNKIHKNAGDVASDAGNEFLKIGKKVLNDPIYLGLKGGESMRLADEGQDLPYSSQNITGLKIDAGQQIVCVPIQKKGFGKNYITIASGNITFTKSVTEPTPVTIRFDISEDQIITIEAWISKNSDGKNPIEKGKVSFSFGESGTIAPVVTNPITTNPYADGPKLDAEIEIKKLQRLCLTHTRIMVKGTKETIYRCGNPEDFFQPIVSRLKKGNNEPYYYLNLIVIARKLALRWSNAQQKELAEYAMDLLRGRIIKSANLNPWMAVYGEAITIIGICGTPQQVGEIKTLGHTENSSLFVSLINCFALQGMFVDWTYDLFFSSEKNRNIASAGIGMSIYKSTSISNRINVTKIVDNLLPLMNDTRFVRNAIISLAYICADEQSKKILGNAKIISIKAKIQEYPQKCPNGVYKPCTIAMKLIEGEKMSAVEEQYLLSLLDDSDGIF